VDTLGAVKKYFNIPKHFKSSSIQKPRHNGTLEGLTIGFDNKGFWIAMELPLEADGVEPALVITNSPVRITYIDEESNLPTKAFAYQLGLIAKAPKGNFAVNGLTDILMYEKDKFYVVERSYSSGLGNQGNTVKIFNVDASKATNIFDFDTLKEGSYIPAKKELLFDFESIKDSLTEKSIDNIEGISFGPSLANKNKTLLLVADNNFNKLGPQKNQFILLEIVDQKSK
ncbi:MAG: esterase-like activity of phytase family protein, partial [Bacteroidia bacterium]|nr:esterase-like activity of phytase family protein [Bacteroidia bacterium]